MAKKMELSIIPEDEITSTFELNAEITAGTLTSNAKELAEKINNELKNYTVEKYINNPDAAKTDKALLNKVKDAVSAKRKEIQNIWNKPLDEFLTEMKNLEDSISDASGKINEIVKEADAKEKNEKRKKIEDYWSTLDFRYVTLEKIFNPKWLNKTYKIDQVMKDCEEMIERITSELSTIKSMNDEDNDILQSFYLETLDLNATLVKGNQLKANRELLKNTSPNETRTEIDKENQKWVDKKLAEPVAEIKKETPVIAPTDNDPVMDYNLILHGPKSKLILVRKYMESIGVSYTKVVK